MDLESKIRLVGLCGTILVFLITFITIYSYTSYKNPIWLNSLTFLIWFLSLSAFVMIPLDIYQVSNCIYKNRQ